MSARANLAKGNKALWGWLAVVASQVILNFGAAALVDVPEDRVYRYSNAVLALLQYGTFFAVVLLIASRCEARGALALNRPRSWSRAVGLGVLVTIGTVVLVASLDSFLRTGEAQKLSPEWDASRLVPFLVNAAVIALVAPVVEELTYRGLGITLLRPFGDGVAVVSTALLFALSHGLLAILPTATALGLALGYLRLRTESVYPALVIHVLLNALATSAIPLAS